MATEEASRRVTKAGAAWATPANVSEMQTGKGAAEPWLFLSVLPVCPFKNCFDKQQKEQINKMAEIKSSSSDQPWSILKWKKFMDGRKYYILVMYLMGFGQV